MRKAWPIIGMLISFLIIILTTNDWFLACMSSVVAFAIMTTLHRIIVGSWT